MDVSTSVGTGHLPTPEGTPTKEGVVDSRLLTFLARGTSGFTAGTLERLVNMAVSKALLDKKDGISLEHLEWAKDQILGHMHKVREWGDESVRIEGKTPVFSIEKPGFCPQCKRSHCL